jgi:hypothetical protein
MTFQANNIKGASSLPGQVDYRLARRFLVNEYKRARLSRLDVCDAHPELVRAATGVGTVSDEDCPICEEAKLTHVTYAFGQGMPAHGKLVTTLAEQRRLQQSPREAACYVVEVCTNCRWNHLAKVFVLGGAKKIPTPRQQTN